MLLNGWDSVFLTEADYYHGYNPHDGSLEIWSSREALELDSLVAELEPHLDRPRQ